MTPSMLSTFTAASAPESPAPESADANGWAGDAPWALGLLLALAAAAILIRRRLAGFSQRVQASRSVRVVETTRLGDQTRVSVIHFKGRELLVAHGLHGTTLLSDRRIDDATGLG